MKQILILVFLFCFNLGCLAESNDHEQIAKELDKLAKRSHCLLGCTAIHIETQEKINYHGTDTFFMASTVKVPIAIALMRAVDNHKEDLNRKITLSKHDLVPGSGNLRHLFHSPSLTISLKELLKRMLIVSDNSASDAILHEVGGPGTVSQWLHSHGYNHILINRSLLDIFIATNGVKKILPKEKRTLQNWEKLFDSIPLHTSMIAWFNFDHDIRDTTTANDMASLLVNLYQNRLLSSDKTEYLISIMQHCKTGKRRLRALLPINTLIAHKTGTWTIYTPKTIRFPEAKKAYRYASDVGIITLPQNKGHLAIAVYVKSKAVADVSREKVIALASRKIYDYFSNKDE